MSTCITFHMSFIDFLPPHKLFAHTHKHTYDDAKRGGIWRWWRRRRNKYQTLFHARIYIYSGTEATGRSHRESWRREKVFLFMIHCKRNFCHWNLFALSEEKERGRERARHTDAIRAHIEIMLRRVNIDTSDVHILLCVCTQKQKKAFFSLQLYRFSPHPLLEPQNILIFLCLLLILGTFFSFFVL